MTRSRTLWRFFLAHQDRDQEALFEAQARQGWHLVRPGLVRFRFEQGEALASRYRLDYQMLRGESRRDYLMLFQDAGWDFLGERMNRYYFRARAEALSPEIHSDPESRRDRIHRELRLLGALLAISGWNASLLGFKVLTEHPWVGGRQGYLAPVDVFLPGVVLLFAITTLGLGWCVWKLAAALRTEA